MPAVLIWISVMISIHALHEESDCSVFRGSAVDGRISIHALHEESDAPEAVTAITISDFNPRSP